MKDEFSISRTTARALLDKMLNSVDTIDSEYPGHYDKLDPFIHLLTARLTGDERPELEILLENQG